MGITKIFKGPLAGYARACCMAVLILALWGMALRCWGQSSAAAGLPPATAGTTQYLHILSTGQSLAIGSTAVPPISTTQPYNNLSLSPGPGGYYFPLIPLVDTLQESPSCGMANTLHALDSLSRPVVMALHGSGGSPYVDLKKGTPPYIKAMAQAVNTMHAVDSMGPSAEYVPLCVTVIHGEHDNYFGNSGVYQSYLEEWQRDYEIDLGATVGHPVNFPMFISQMNTGWTGEMPVAQLQAHKDNPGKIIMVGPKYHSDYSDGLHYNVIDAKNAGEMMAKVIHKVLLKGETWNPLMPTAVTRYDSVILVDYHIPVGHLVVDTSWVKMRPNWGFEFAQTGGDSTWITDVQLVNGDTKVQITLSQIPNGTDPRLRYAYTCRQQGTGLSYCGGRMDSLAIGGNIRDQDSMVSPAVDGTGRPLYNWGVTFDEPVLDPVGITSTPLVAEMTVHPNPSSGSLNVDWPGAVGELKALRLHDLSGRLVRDWREAGRAGQWHIRLEGLPAGLYWLEGEGESGLRLGCRVLVQ